MYGLVEEIMTLNHFAQTSQTNSKTVRKIISVKVQPEGCPRASLNHTNFVFLFVLVHEYSTKGACSQHSQAYDGSSNNSDSVAAG